jgi:hypothetical protein
MGLSHADELDEGAVHRYKTRAARINNMLVI